MATVGEIRDAVKGTLEAAIADFRCYDTVPDLASVPATIVLPVESDFATTFGRGFDTHQIDLFVMVSRVAPRSGQDSLDAFVTGQGPQSIRQAIFNNRTLGLAGTDAFIRGMSRYGGTFTGASIDHIGAVLRLVVTSPGTI